MTITGNSFAFSLQCGLAIKQLTSEVHFILSQFHLSERYLHAFKQLNNNKQVSYLVNRSWMTTALSSSHKAVTIIQALVHF